MKQDYNQYKEYFKEHYRKNKAKRLDLTKQSKENRYEEVKTYDNEWKKKNRIQNPEAKIKEAIRSRINRAVRDGFKNKFSGSICELGCSIEEYFVYLEQRFSYNMSWENYGLYWEIDHIIPLSKGGGFHYTNTQPLNITENRSKGNRI